MWIDVVESGEWLRQLYDVVPSLEQIRSYRLTVEEGGSHIEIGMFLPVPLDHSAVRGRGSNGIGFDLIFEGVRSFRGHVIGEHLVASAELKEVDGQVVFHGSDKYTDFTIVADRVSIRK